MSEKPKEIRKLPKPPGRDASIKEVRDYFQTYRPTLEELIATGDYEGPLTLAAVLERHGARKRTSNEGSES